MKRDLVEAIRENIGFPIYVLRERKTGWRVEKVGLSDKGKVETTYHLVSLDQCTCSGFVHRGKCKHLHIVNGTWEGTGISPAAAAAVVERVLETLSGHVESGEELLRQFREKNSEKNDFALDTVERICLNLGRRGEKGVRRIECEMTVAEGRTVIVSLTFAE